ncbi:DUF7919 family protein [Streptomyces mirabilis]
MRGAPRGCTITTSAQRRSTTPTRGSLPAQGTAAPARAPARFASPGPPGIAFAAPQLIGHYVADHSYLPPRRFVDAVFAFDLQGTSSTSYPWITFPWIPDDADLCDARVE